MFSNSQPVLRTARELLLKAVTQYTSLHSSSINLRKKEKFYNQYFKEYKPRTYKGFIEPLMEKADSDLILNFHEDEPDYRKTILKEARKRQHIYHHKRTKKEVEGKMNRTRIFTAEQMRQIKFLHSEDPELWSPSHLAMSFRVDSDVISRILKSRYSPKPEATELKDNYTEQNLRMLTQPQSEATVLPSTEVIQPMPPDLEEVKKNPWFRPFDEGGKSVDNVEFVSEEEALDLVEDESYQDEHYELFECEDEDFEDDEDSEDDEEDADEPNDEAGSDDSIDINFKIKSDDNVTFYDDEGRFLYKVS